MTLQKIYIVMKKSILALLLLSWLAQDSFSQTTTLPDSLGLPGDNLNLYAVLDLFEKSETFEIFEKKLNDKSLKINNLDLNNDNKIDYIRVIDNKSGDDHAIVLHVPINEKENQDVAVIELEKDKAGKYQLQIIGNEELYGKDYIIEPSSEKPATSTEKNTSQQKSNTTNVTINQYYYVDPVQWPMISYVYGPAYVVYVSPWYWGYYPSYWRPWRPWYYHTYYYHHYNRYPGYHQHFHRATVYRSPAVHSYYGPRQSTSVVVRQNNVQGSYRRSYQSTNSTRTSRNPGYSQVNRRNYSPKNNRVAPNSSNPRTTRKNPAYNTDTRSNNNSSGNNPRYERRSNPSQQNNRSNTGSMNNQRSGVQREYRGNQQRSSQPNFNQPSGNRNFRQGNPNPGGGAGGGGRQSGGAGGGGRRGR
jgi:hypothetical protein